MVVLNNSTKPIKSDSTKCENKKANTSTRVYTSKNETSTKHHVKKIATMISKTTKTQVPAKSKKQRKLRTQKKHCERLIFTISLFCLF